MNSEVHFDVWAKAEELVLIERAYGRRDAVRQIALALDAYAQERERATWEAAAIAGHDELRGVFPDLAQKVAAAIRRAGRAAA